MSYIHPHHTHITPTSHPLPHYTLLPRQHTPSYTTHPFPHHPPLPRQHTSSHTHTRTHTHTQRSCIIATVSRCSVISFPNRILSPGRSMLTLVTSANSEIPSSTNYIISLIADVIWLADFERRMPRSKLNHMRSSVYTNICMCVVVPGNCVLSLTQLPK